MRPKLGAWRADGIAPRDHAGGEGRGGGYVVTPGDGPGNRNGACKECTQRIPPKEWRASRPGST
ncbi:MAG: hypothetical protein AMXMBFR55_19260 [Gemmatimonadota bacterium]